jgi:hypothetical protein
MATAFKLDVYYNGESIELIEDRKTVQQYGFRDKMVTKLRHWTVFLSLKMFLKESAMSNLLMMIITDVASKTS